MPNQFVRPNGDFENDSDEVLTARMIFGEARGENEEGKYAVAYVAKNRKREKNRSWQEVILQRKQFSCFNKKDPNYEKIKDPETEDPQKWEECLRIARVVVSCNDSFNTIDGCTHYLAKGTETDWSEGKEPFKVIGKHKFYRGIGYSVPKQPDKPVKPEGEGGKDSETSEVRVGLILDNLLKKEQLLEIQKQKKQKEKTEKYDRFIEILEKLIEQEMTELEKASAGGKVTDSSSEESKCIMYTVKKGDTLGEIAKRFGVNIDEIKHADESEIPDKNSIREGEVLCIPKK